jgi:hypothetical protein
MADAFDDAPVQVAELPHIKLFGKWSSEDVNHSDMSLAVSLSGLLLGIVCKNGNGEYGNGKKGKN